ncbi:hypothetical protein SANTM175S_02566 [Streptomyces antimycoticus]
MPASVGDVASVGLELAGHPLLGAAVPLAESDGLVFTGRLGLDTHPWLADHTVRDAVMVPGPAFVELAVRAGDQVGCDLLDELTPHAPLVLPARGGVRLQVTVGASDDAGRRSFTVSSRPEDAAADTPVLGAERERRCARLRRPRPVVRPGRVATDRRRGDRDRVLYARLARGRAARMVRGSRGSTGSAWLCAGTNSLPRSGWTTDVKPGAATASPYPGAADAACTPSTAARAPN